MVGAIPSASAEVLTDAAHLPSLERPVDITAILVSFLNRMCVRPMP